MEINIAGKLIGWCVALVVMAGWSLWEAVRKRSAKGANDAKVEPFNGMRMAPKEERKEKKGRK